MKLPRFKPSGLAVNEPKTIRIKNIQGPFSGDYGDYFNITIHDGLEDKAWLLSASTKHNNEHIIKEGADISVLRTMNGTKTNFSYSVPGDIAHAPQNVPPGHEPHRNMRQINQSKGEDLNMKIWRGQALNLAAAATGPKKDMEEWKKVVMARWINLYEDEEFRNSILNGFDAPAPSNNEMESLAATDPGEEIISELPF